MIATPVKTSGERTDILYGVENIIDFTIQSLSLVERSFDVCTDSNGPSVILSSEKIKNAYYGLREKGVKIRFVAEITDYNLLSCKQVMEFAELRHLDGVKGGFGISDGTTYAATALHSGEKPITQLIYSNVKALVEQQQYMFDTLWNKAIPAKQRIKEIEENLKREFIETIRDTDETTSLISKVLSSATDEILMIFSRASTLKKYEKFGMLYIVRKKADKVEVRILIGTDKTIYERDVEWLRQYPQIELRYLNKSIHTSLTTIVADRRLSLVIEEKKDEDEDIDLGLATYSNSESTVMSCASIFENLWAQSTSQNPHMVRYHNNTI
jgi:hypothetical protein